MYLDDDDMLELTYLEKSVWMLETNSMLHIISPYHRGFGEANYTWTRGFHYGISNYYQSGLVGAVPVFRTESVRKSNCKYDTNLLHGAEDWDFFLCLADAGVWGTTLPEYHFWYRTKLDSKRTARWGDLFGQRKQSNKQYIQNKYKELESKSIESPHISDSTAFEYVNWTLPFVNKINNLSVKGRVMLVIPWTTIGGADISFLHLVRQFARNGYSVTLICTLYNPPSSITMIDQFY